MTLKVLFLSSEVAPFAKTGGLADVAGALPGALKKLGLDVEVALPFYREVVRGGFSTHEIIKDLRVPLGKRHYNASIFQTMADGGVPVYLVEREDMYDRSNLYGDLWGDYYDNLARFTFFTQAVFKLMEKSDVKADIIHCHDWQTGLIPAFIKGPYSGSDALRGVKSVFTIHNIGYQGIFPAEDFYITGLPASDFFSQEGMEFWGNFSLLKAGIVYSDAITTVSPRYSREIKTSEYGMGMEGILQSKEESLSGILNGVDYATWNPAVDRHIPVKYASGTLEGKIQCKEALLRETGLSYSIKREPLVCMISRLDLQKGVDLFIKILNEMLKMDIKILILGSGRSEIEDELMKVSKGNEDRFTLRLGFDEALAHRIIAGADIFLIPSRYEPCGLTQMYALKYGTIPVVRATGGLDDTISEHNPRTGKGNGFKFDAYEPEEFLAAVKRAVGLYGDRNKWIKLMRIAMEEDFSWERSAIRYMELYESLHKAD